MQRSRLLLLCAIVSTLSGTLAGPVDQPNAQRAQLSLQTSHSFGLCNDSRCSCNDSSHGMANVICQCSPQDQEATLDIHKTSVPPNVSSVVIRSCRSVIVHEAGFKHLSHLSNVTVEDVGEVVFHPASFNQTHVVKAATVIIGRCRQLTIKSGAFLSHPLKPVALSSSHCHSVRIEESAFSRLSRLTLSNVQSLHLASLAFRFATASPVDGDHIRSEIVIEHANMTEIKSFTFPSPLDRLVLDNVTVTGQIQSNATSALRIVQLSIHGSRIGSIAGGAFSEFTHLDSLEMRYTSIGDIDERAFSSAASSFIMEVCQIGRMNRSALSMPVARVTLHSNQINVLSTGAIYLREWNELLIENNTVTLVERHAFYNIGEPKLLPSPKAERDVRFVIRYNNFQQVEQGAFVISAQVPQLKLEANSFQQVCDCQMAGWAAQLTQITRIAETTTSASFIEDSVPDALWLGSSLFNSSLCWLDQIATECLDLSQPQFLSMNNYTEEFCSDARETELSRCVATRRALLDVSRIIEFDIEDGSVTKLVGFSSRQDLVMIIVLGALSACVLLAVCLGMAIIRFKSKTRRQNRGRKAASDDERVTCSPLIPNVEKQLGSGVVSSGSISRLSVKEYRNYLEELGPIYSEPLDPPNPSGWQALASHSVPPAIPTMPSQWTPKTTAKIEDTDRQTMDRGTQTNTKIPESVDSSENMDEGDPPSSLALEFTQDVMAALRDKMEVSPLYSEVKDSVVTKEKNIPPSEGGDATPELYDLIRVVDGDQRPSTSSAKSEHIYCKPWSADQSESRLPSVDDAASIELKMEDKQPSDSQSAAGLKNVPASKNQPFHVRGSVPKWPPPAREDKLANRNNTEPRITSASSIKDAKPPPWRNSSRPAPKKSPTTSSGTPAASAKTKSSPNQSKLQSAGKPSAAQSIAPDGAPRSPPPTNEGENNAEVTGQSSSFSFRRPADGQDKSGMTGPPKPARTALLCEYADPHDLSEPLYSELVVQDEKRNDLL
ncbi:uncharacterized protein LOC130694750 [Daphnia carinata]|uniref:uncharacterized protein LOC130694750 n=1 Tax=Daphnia carinata TaxID=120202 RepID=UPI00257C0726|nr:uncharacterized protein LOC130694750 [Daphnia carinata]